MSQKRIMTKRERLYHEYNNKEKVKEELIELQYECDVAESVKTEFSFARKASLEGLVKEGDLVNVKYIGTDPKNGKAKLSRKALIAKPEATAEENKA